MRRYFFILSIFLVFSMFVFTGCEINFSSNETAKIKIGETEYNSLAEAIYKAQAGDAILIFNDFNENIENEYVKALSHAEVGDDVYVAYEINKPLVIKGVIQKTKRPKVKGTFLINIGEEKYKDNSVTVDNLEIEHGYVSYSDQSINEDFVVGVRVFDGSANIVNNDIHTISQLNDEEIKNKDLSLCYGVMLSRPNESELMGETFHYEIIDNKLGEYVNSKDGAFAAPLIILENSQGVGAFMPAIINTKASNFALELSGKNAIALQNCIKAVHIDEASGLYYSIYVNDKFNIDFSKLEDENCKLIFDGDFLNDNIMQVDVYGLFVFSGDVQNVIFNLKNKQAKVEILGEQLGELVINKYNEKSQKYATNM